MCISCLNFTQHDASRFQWKHIRVLREWTGTRRNIQHSKVHTPLTKRTPSECQGAVLELNLPTGPRTLEKKGSHREGSGAQVPKSRSRRWIFHSTLPPFPP